MYSFCVCGPVATDGQGDIARPKLYFCGHHHYDGFFLHICGVYSDMNFVSNSIFQFMFLKKRLK
ncbi:hypothetical protein CAEBREN_07170 [Caenorhabditis brenneri]|uniref:Uncharacterized protein n=1 Tax=Caenorhabditis brenneri TaxID=135651 RepID=G0MH80_CAEBE|nr:hypothetical protein CAEBREN_07170 [Caenorhabditis brenneri]